MRKAPRLHRPLVVCSLLGALAACGSAPANGVDSDSPTNVGTPAGNPGTSAIPATARTAGTSMMTSTRGSATVVGAGTVPVQTPGGGDGTTTPAQPLASDAQILAVLNAAADGEVQIGNLAQTAATRADVRSFAMLMVNDHTADAQHAQALQTQLNATPEASQASTDMDYNMSNELETLRTAARADFDRMYIDAQVTDHDGLLQLIDTALLPGAQSEGMRSLLTTLRAHVADHLAEALRLQESINGTGGSDGSGG